MNWLAWRQHRKQFVILVVILALYAGIAIPMGLHLWHTYQYALTGCKKADDCAQLSNNLFQTGWSKSLNPNVNGFNAMDLLVLVAPFLLGMFVGVPLIAREYASKTNLLIWTRSISRRKWLTTKLVWILASSAVFAGVFTTLNTWWSRAGNSLYVDRFNTPLFGVQGITPIGYTILAVSIGVALGAWLKRTMLAIGLTLLLMVAVQITVFNFVRSHYMSPLVTTVWTNQFGPDIQQGQASQIPSGAWVTNFEIVNKTGQALNWSNPPKSCIVPQNELPQPVPGGHHHMVVAPGNSNGSIMSINGGPVVQGSCLESQGYHYLIKYQPGYRYWDFQRIELGLYLALSVIPLGAAYWLVLKRDA